MNPFTESFFNLPEATTLEDARAYSSNSPILRMNNEKFFYNIASDGAVMHPVEQSETYFKNAHIIMEIDIATGDMRPVGKYSQYYIDNHSKHRLHYQPIYDLSKSGNFIVSYPVDSLIYLSNKEHSPIKAFGYEGKNMDKDYAMLVADVKSYREAYRNEIVNRGKGYYYWVKYMDETDMTFRSYTRGHTLIADVDVPADFKVAGYIPPYYVSQIIFDLENEVMKFYRFKL